MPHYRLCRKNESDGDCMWVLASSEVEARELFSLNAVDEASDPEIYECILDGRFAPPFGVIMAHGPGGTRTITVKKRQQNA